MNCSYVKLEISSGPIVTNRELEIMAKLAELLETEIPAGRRKLQESHTNLLKVASFCEENYMKAENKRDALAETKHYTTQSLASVAYQINTLATSMLQMLDLQGVQLADMESSTNHLARNVSVHKEKVSRREIGVLTTSKGCRRTHKIVAPAETEKPIKYKPVPIDYSLLDDVGHGLKISDPAKASSAVRKRKESQTIPSPGVVTDNFPIFNPDARPPNSPLESDLYATVRKNVLITPQSSPKSVRQYRSMKAVPVGGQPSGPPPPPPDPDMPPPPHPMPPAPDTCLPPALAPLSMAPPPPSMPGTKVAFFGKKELDEAPDEAVSSMPPPPPTENNSYPANLGIGDDEMPPPPEFVQTDDVDQFAPADYIEKVIAIYVYEKNLDDELTFQEDDIIYVLKKNPNGWFEGVLNGVTGLFPGNYVQAVP